MVKHSATPPVPSATPIAPPQSPPSPGAEVTKCGYVAIMGRPNVGKSTLLNRLLGSKISITADKPQTTRHQIVGVKTQGAVQALYVDTPGIHHKNHTTLNQQMNRAAWSALQDVDVLLFVVDRTRWTDDEERILEKMKNITVPFIVVINKVDHLANKNELLPALQKLGEKIPAQAFFPVSAKTGVGVAELETYVLGLLPAGPHLFGAEDKSNRQQRFHISEIVREKLIRFLGDELPHATTVEIERLQKGEKITEIHAVIWVEREGQKKIIIGAGGSHLKKMATAARKSLEQYLNGKVMLRTWVKVKSGWRDDREFLKNVGMMDE